MPSNVPKFTRACIDSPSEADTFETKLRDGDMVMAYVCLSFCPVPAAAQSAQTDGLLDNVFLSEIISICNLVARSGRSEDEQVQTMADRIVDYAQQCMVNKKRVSPFESMSIFYLCDIVF
jgi:protein phosphatase PTC7